SFQYVVVVSFASSSISTLRFCFYHTPTTDTYSLSLHDALPIYFRLFCQGAYRFLTVSRGVADVIFARTDNFREAFTQRVDHIRRDRKSTRLNSSHVSISYAVFCLKKKTSKCRPIPS